jgi:hypothetical protein
MSRYKIDNFICKFLIRTTHIARMNVKAVESIDDRILIL